MPHILPRLHRHPPIALALFAACACLGSMPDDARAQSSQAARSHDIPAGPLDQALNRFAAEAGILLTIDASLTAGKQSPGLKGSASPAQGLGQLLQGTGLEAVQGDKGWQLRRIPAPVSGETTLAPVTVSAQAERNGITEGSGSYTATGPSGTATGLALSLRETPQSVTVMTRQRMDDFKLETLTDVLEQAPGVTVSRQNDMNSFNVRGASVNLQTDGARRISTGWGWNTHIVHTLDDLADIDRVEVLKAHPGWSTATAPMAPPST